MFSLGVGICGEIVGVVGVEETAKKEGGQWCNHTVKLGDVSHERHWLCERPELNRWDSPCRLS